MSLCQFVLLAIGAWVALRLDYATSLPFPFFVLIAGVITGVLGTLIGLPALRLEGLYLALITLMAAGAITVVLRIALFPNGGGGFFGNSAAGVTSSRLPRPRWPPAKRPTTVTASSSPGLMFCSPLARPGKAGRAWAAIRQSQATAVAAGVNITLYKLWAFALASFMAGSRAACWRRPAVASTSTSSRSQNSISSSRSC